MVERETFGWSEKVTLDVTGKHITHTQKKKKEALKKHISQGLDHLGPFITKSQIQTNV